MSEYSLFNATGGSITAGTTRAYDGSYSLEHHTDGTGLHGIASTSGLQNYPDRADTIDFRYYAPLSSGVVYYFFGFQDANNYYQVNYRSDTYGHQLKVIQSGSATTLASNSSPPFPTDEWCRHVIEWKTGGTIVSTVYDSAGNQQSQISASDSTFDKGGIGFGHDNYNGTANTMYFDFNRVI